MGDMAGHRIAMQESCCKFTKSFPSPDHLLDDAAEPPSCLQAPPLLPGIFRSNLGLLRLCQKKLLKNRYHIAFRVGCDLDETPDLLVIGEGSDVAQGSLVLFKSCYGVLRIAQ